MSNHEAPVFGVLVILSRQVCTCSFRIQLLLYGGGSSNIGTHICSLVVLSSIDLLGGIQGREATGIKIEMWLVAIGTCPSLYSCGWPKSITRRRHISLPVASFKSSTCKYLPTHCPIRVTRKQKKKKSCGSIDH